jgi:protein SCO1/2
MIRRLVLSLAAISFLGLCAFIIYYQATALPQTDNNQSIDDYTVGGSFQLIDQDKRVRTSDEFLGKYTLLYFGYAFCPDICPQALTHMSELIKLLGRDRDQVVPVFITLDPARDTYNALKLYSENYHPTFVMLTGSEKTIKDLQKNYKVYASRIQSEDITDGYLMDHSSLIYVLSREGKVIKMFSHTTPAKDMYAFFTKRMAEDYKNHRLSKRDNE